MPKIPPPRKGVFPVPNALIDALLPSLRDTELRVLLLVLRQTWGWTDPGTGRPKTRDRLTHGRLRRDTGRAGEAVSAAVDALARRGLVIVEGEKGGALATPAERRRARALYFLPGHSLRGVEFPEAVRSGEVGRKTQARRDRKTEVRKPKTTKDNSDKNICPLRKSEHAAKSSASSGKQKPSAQDWSGGHASEEGLTAEQIASIEATRRQIRARLAQVARE